MQSKIGRDRSQAETKFQAYGCHCRYSQVRGKPVRFVHGTCRSVSYRCYRRLFPALYFCFLRPSYRQYWGCLCSYIGGNTAILVLLDRLQLSFQHFLGIRLPIKHNKHESQTDRQDIIRRRPESPNSLDATMSPKDRNIGCWCCQAPQDCGSNDACRPLLADRRYTILESEENSQSKVGQ